MQSDAPDGHDSTADTAFEGVRPWVVVYLKGLAMGVADAVPGVSGGTIALVVGIYERLIRALTALDPTVVASLPRLHDRHERAGFYRALREMDIPFLIVLGTGMGSALVVLARVVHRALEAVPALTFAVFFGLIAASAVVLFERHWVGTPGRVLAAIAGFGTAYAIAGVSGQGLLPHSLPVVFLAGAVAVAGTVLPGISGAFILLLLGQYEFMAGTLTRFVDSTLRVFVGGTVGELLGPGLVVVTFLCGAVLGVVTIAHVIGWAIERYRAATFAFLVSLMLGALRLPVVRIDGAVSTWTPGTGFAIAFVTLVGAGTVVVLDQYTEDLGYQR